MVTGVRLVPKLRRKLRNPLGTLFEGPPDVGIKKLRSLLSKTPAPKLIAVGDVVTEGMERVGMKADLYIVDNMVMRKPIKPIQVKVDAIINVTNPRSTITREAWLAIEKALRSSIRTKISVNGEEDLLALPAALISPENSIVIYGQPNEGIVMIKATRRKKAELQKLLNAMEIVR